MKKKHIIAFVCVLALAVSLFSSFTFAAAPEENVEVSQEGARTGGVHYVVRIATYMYAEPNPYSARAYPDKLPVGTNLVKIGEDGVWYRMQYGSYKGYILRTYLTEVQ